MPSLNEHSQSGREYWRSLDDVADTPEFREFVYKEFPAGATSMLDDAGRRHFLKIMAASMAFAGLGLSGCRRWPKEVIAPYASRPEDRTPGVPVHYASIFADRGIASGVLVASMDGRPIKIEGNPEHPSSLGGTDSFAQASILDLYDPDRSRAPRNGDTPTTFAAFESAMGERLTGHRGRRGAGLHILTGATASPTELALRQRIRREMPEAKWYEYEALNNDEVVRGAEMAFGSGTIQPVYDLSKAKTIVTLDSDFMFDDPSAVRLIREFAAGRRAADDADESMSCFYAFESRLSLTGSNADHRLAMRSGDVALVAAWLATRILEEDGLRRFESAPAATEVLDADAMEMLEHVLKDLLEHRRESVIIPGKGQPAEVHYLAHLMNHALGNFGETVSRIARTETTPHAASLAALATAMADGAVETLVILGGNPAYDAPADLNFATLLDEAGGDVLTVYHGDYENETSTRCRWHVHRSHYLESWTDGRGEDGTMSVGQPLILPLFDGKSTIEILALIAGDDLRDGEQLVRRTFGEMTSASDPDRLWRRTLHDGLLAGSSLTRDARSPQRAALNGASDALFQRWSSIDRGTVEVVFHGDYSVLDGRYANNGWLQEVPDPITKLTWDNAVAMSPAMARELNVGIGDMVQVTVGSSSVTAPVMLVPGHAEDCVSLPLGYGRTFDGRICTDAGFDFYPLRTTTAMAMAGGTVSRTGDSYPLATTQDHHAIDVESVGGRGIQKRLPTLIREASLEEYRSDPKFAAHRTHVTHRLSLWDETNLQNGQYAWAMSIDLTSCVGCNACIIACQAENNIPIVGKDQVIRGREMHWLRMDRYFTFGKNADGTPNPDDMKGVRLQPVTCVHCENAPCEQVCPVAATVHDEDGLNVMVYNRCIGTRYCSNNCPYKVRRFNYFDYHRRDPAREQPGTLLAVEPKYFERKQAAAEPLQQLQFNPEVSVRVRGVMEKCTYCTQRIALAKIEAKNEWAKTKSDDPAREQERIPVADGAVQTACEQACPAQAIVFGDLNDPNSRVAKMHKHPRAYEMLEELNIKPRTRYLAKVHNPRFGDMGGDHGHGHGHDHDHADAEVGAH